METVRLTSFSHGAGCGCKISPAVLDKILAGNGSGVEFPHLIVGNESKDDAAVMDLGDGRAIISTTDFFMPIVDDPFTFGRIAAANAISDIYAMGGRPILAIAILGWPVNQLAPEVARKVIEGGRSMCLEAGIPLAGGHSIDSPEPIFGLAVNGMVDISKLKRNDTAREGDFLFLTKRLGVGILTTAEKKGVLLKEHQNTAAEQMVKLNSVGHLLGEVSYVNAMTDVTGFGLLGHLSEMSQGSGVSSEIYFENIPKIVPEIEMYVTKGSIPGGTERNWMSYGANIDLGDESEAELRRVILADPQTSGGLLISVHPDGVETINRLFAENGLDGHIIPIGSIIKKRERVVYVL
jgi:selenide,water dikinase